MASKKKKTLRKKSIETGFSPKPTTRLTKAAALTDAALTGTTGSHTPSPSPGAGG